MKWKALAILSIIIVSLLPVYILYKYIEKKMRPKESMQRFLLWLLVSFALIFAYTFLLVFLLKLVFPGE
jgi:cytochrome c biogenesis protein CcdA